MDIRTKRAYEPAASSDGYRVLIDRLWPRGVSRERARLDKWDRELPPSAKFREWFAHEPSRFEEFRRRYIEELRGQPPAPHGAPATGPQRHAHPGLRGPGHRTQRRRRPRRGFAPRTADGPGTGVMRLPKTLRAGRFGHGRRGTYPRCPQQQLFPLGRSPYLTATA